jgi:ribonucleotide monophosphatase NagD (HAD superfamily)
MKQKTIFSDIDGTLVHQVQFENIDPFTSKALPGAVEILTKMFKEGHHIVLTTARPESLREVTIEEMDLLGIPFHQLLRIQKRNVLRLSRFRKTLVSKVTDYKIK